MDEKPIILLIDDEPGILETYKMAFSYHGMDVLTASDGKEGLVKAKDAMPDAIVVDLMMPNLNGKQFIREIRENSDLKNVPILVCTALGEELEKNEALAAGATDYFVKTESDPYKLVASVEKALGHEATHTEEKDAK